MNSKLNLVLFTVLLFAISKSYAQKNFPQEINNNLNKYLIENIQEKLYLQTNSNRYYPGDTIWYKASLVNAINHKPVGTENMFYIDLISPENKLVSHELYGLLDGFSDGSVTLDAGLKPGKYKLLAYTNYMRNFGSDFLFQKPISLVLKITDQTSWDFNSEIAPVAGGDSVYVKMFAQTRNGRELNEKVNVHLQLAHGTIFGAECNINNNIGSFSFFVPDSLKIDAALLSVIDGVAESSAKKYKINLSVQKPDIQFLPESGDLVANQENKIAFRCVDVNGNPINIQGEVFSGDKKSLVSFSTEYDGMGSFDLLTQPDKNYYAQVNYHDSVFTYDLPDIPTEAYSLKLINQDVDSIHFNILKSGNATPEFLLVGHCRGNIKFMNKGVIDKDAIAVHIPTANISDGILTLTLFVNEMPKAERLVYIDKHDDFDFNLVKLDTGENDSVANYILQVNKPDGIPVNGNFSLTGWNSKIETSLDSLENIRNYLLFSSDLQGEIVANTAVFDKKDSISSHFKNLMLMTYGWRRFNWDKVTQYKTQKHTYAADQDFYLKGKIQRRFSDKPVPKKTEISIVLKQPGAVHIDKAIVDKNGEFSFILPAFCDSASLTFQTKNRRTKPKDYVVDLSTNLEKFHINSLDFDKVLKTESYPLVRNRPPLTEITNSEKKESQPLEYTFTHTLNVKKPRIDNYYFPGKDTIMIEEVEARSNYLNRRDSVLNETGEPNIVIESSQLKRLTEEKAWYQDIWDLIEDQVPGLQIMQEPLNPLFGDNYNLIVNGDINDLLFCVEDNPDGYLYIFIDDDCLNSNRLIDKYDFLYSLNPGEIESIDFIAKPDKYTKNMSMNDVISENNLSLNTDVTSDQLGSMTKMSATTFRGQLASMRQLEHAAAAPAFLVITTKNKGGIYYPYSKGLQSLYLTGLTAQKEFYEPKYHSIEKAKQENQYKKTILWQPELITDKSGTTKIAIPKGTVNANTLFQIQGISAQGESVSHTFSLNSFKENTKNQLADLAPVTAGTSMLTSTDNYAELNLFYGLITDAENGQPVPFVDLRQDAPYYHMCTNNKGEFFLQKDRLINNSIITISSPGYKTQQLVMSSIQDTLIQVQMVRADVAQPEDKTNAVSIVRKAIGKSRRSYNTKTSLQGYNRETVSIDNNVYGIYETGFNYFNTGLPGTESTVRFETLKFHNMEDKSSNKHTVLQPNHRCLFYPLKRDVIASPLEFWELESLEYFDYKETGQVEYDGEICYKIHFQQKENLVTPLQNGILYIGKESGALRYAGWGTTPDKRIYVSYTDFLQSNPMDYDVQLTDDYYEVSYSLVNKQLNLQASSQQLKILVNGKNNLEFKSRLSIANEIDDKVRLRSNKNPDMLIRRQESKHMLVRNPEYNVEPWIKFGLIKPEDSLLENVSYLHDITVNGEGDYTMK